MDDRAAGHAGDGVRAEPVPARAHRRDRRDGGAGGTGRARRADRRRRAAAHALPADPACAGRAHPPVRAAGRGRGTLVGAPVAAVVAEGRGAAQDAAALVDVAYEPLDAVADVEAALAEGRRSSIPSTGATSATGSVRQRRRRRGVRGAYRTVRLRVAIPRVAPAPMEPRGALAQYDAGRDELTEWVTTQTPHRTREWLADRSGHARPPGARHRARHGRRLRRA